MITYKSVPNSSTIYRLKYDDDRRELTVTFVNGAQYLYTDVPLDVFEEMIKAESIGSFFAKNIKAKYAFRHLTEVE